LLQWVMVVTATGTIFVIVGNGGHSYWLYLLTVCYFMSKYHGS